MEELTTCFWQTRAFGGNTAAAVTSAAAWHPNAPLGVPYSEEVPMHAHHRRTVLYYCNPPPPYETAAQPSPTPPPPPHHPSLALARHRGIVLVSQHHVIFFFTSLAHTLKLIRTPN